MSAFRFVLLMLLSKNLAAQTETYNPDIDVIRYSFDLTVSDASDTLIGSATIGLKFRHATDSCWLDLHHTAADGKGMQVLSIFQNMQAGAGQRTRTRVRYSHKSDRLILYTHADSGSQRSFIIRYKGIPADGLIIARNSFGHRGFFGDNWPDRAHHWLPCVDHPSDKALVSFTVTAPARYTVVSNGALRQTRWLKNNQKQTCWSSAVPLSPKIMVVGIAGFLVDHPGDADGIPVYNYVFPESNDSGFRSYAHALEILPFFIRRIGPYPFEKCGNVQSKTRFGGLENAGAIFYHERSVSSGNIISLMSHEIAHQWFGDAVTESDWPHLWLSEGFATYMSHCYLEHRYGQDSLRRLLAIDRKKIFDFEKLRCTPIIDTSVRHDLMKLLNPNSYEKAGWVLHMLRRTIGDSLFWKAISAYYTAFHNRNASTDDLIGIVEQTAHKDLKQFFRQWLYDSGHPVIQLDWHFDTASGALFIASTQRQDQLYEFPLELAIDGRRYILPVTAKNNEVRIPMVDEPATVIPDPDVNVLAEFIF